MENLLMAILDCGSADLGILDDCNCDYSEIIGRLKEEGLETTLGNIIGEIFNSQVNVIINAVNDRIYELEDDIKALDMEELEELRLIKDLSSEDFNFYFNYLDTHMSILKNREIYESYFQEALSEFLNMTGFDLE